MEVLASVAGLALIIIIFGCIQFNSKEGTYGFGMFCGFIIAVLFAIEIMCIYGITSKTRPKAMDVYQGKTTIEYTIRDGVKVDSVVVFKKEK